MQKASAERLVLSQRSSKPIVVVEVHIVSSLTDFDLVDVAYIPLTAGKFAMVDARDYEWLNQWRWHFKTSNGRKDEGYAARIQLIDGFRIHRVIHRLVLAKHTDFSLESGLDVDHINRNKLDNRLFNLRPASRHENGGNRGCNKDNKCGYKGVNLYSNGKWKAQIVLQGKKVSLGYYLTAEEAAIAYNQASIEAYGEFAFLNDVDPGIVVNRLEYRGSKGYVAKGVCYNKKGQKWQAYARVNKRVKHIGYFKTEEEAINARKVYLESVTS